MLSADNTKMLKKRRTSLFATISLPHQHCCLLDLSLWVHKLFDQSPFFAHWYILPPGRAEEVTTFRTTTFQYGQGHETSRRLRSDHLTILAPLVQQDCIFEARQIGINAPHNERTTYAPLGKEQTGN